MSVMFHDRRKRNNKCHIDDDNQKINRQNNDDSIKKNA